jgi:ABC-type multidrug transport system fused ATPase/permease subunit
MNIDLEPAGGLLSATLVASEIEGQGGAAAGKHAHANCANCQTPLTGSFCHACGQRDHVHRSLLHLGEEFLHGLLHFDAKAWRTLPLLVARPGKLTREYIEGKRTRYVSPLALFLFMVFLMFFVVSSVSHTGGEEEAGSIASATSGVDKALAKARAKLARANAEVAAAQARGESTGKAQARADAAQADVKEEEEALSQVAAGLDKVASAGKPLSENNDDVDTGWPKLDKAIKHAIKNPEFTLYKLKNAASKFSFLLVPISLPFLWLLFFWKRGVTMYDHAVFVLYSLSFMSLLVTVLAVLKMAGLKPLVVWLVFLAPPLHMFLQLRGTYMLGVMSTLWRTAALLIISATVFTLYLLLILMLSMAG